MFPRRSQLSRKWWPFVDVTFRGPPRVGFKNSHPCEKEKMQKAIAVPSWAARTSSHVWVRYRTSVRVPALMLCLGLRLDSPRGADYRRCIKSRCSFDVFTASQSGCLGETAFEAELRQSGSAGFQLIFHTMATSLHAPLIGRLVECCAPITTTLLFGRRGLEHISCVISRRELFGGITCA
jgi:hypothetical protein